jgi:AmiR/NasT family two-component response regulator
MGQIKTILMQRDGMTEQEADELIADAKTDMNERLANGEMPDDICEEWFGLEPDYIFELL